MPVSEETFALLKRAQRYAKDFGGLFDVTIGAVTDLWGFASHEPHRPPTTSIDAHLLLVDARRMVLSAADTTVYLPERRMRLDLGGIAKGYAIDRAAHILREQGLTDFLLNAGGDVFVSGTNREHAPWRVGIKHPRRPQALLATLELTDYAIATSGDYERCFEVDGRRFHHIIDPRTGFPGNRSQSATVLAPTAELADVLATVLFIRGQRDPTAMERPIRSYVLVATSGEVACDSMLFERRHLVLRTDESAFSERDGDSGL